MRKHLESSSVGLRRGRDHIGPAAGVADAGQVTKPVSNEQSGLDPGFIENSVGLQFPVPRIDTTVSTYVHTYPLLAYFRALLRLFSKVYGGEGGIRTPDRVTPMPDFESGAFNRALPPLR